MKITKFPQSCLLIETKGKKILIDPSVLKYKEEYFGLWKDADIILITHKHPDHCNTEVMQKLNKDIKIYSTNEVKKANQMLDINIIKENDIIELENIKIEVVHAIHGYHPLLKGGKEIEDKKIVLGGCVVSDNDPKYHCNNCSYKFD